jgi:hypothetical protein
MERKMNLVSDSAINQSTGFFSASAIKVRSGGLASSNQGAGTGQYLWIISPKNSSNVTSFRGIFMNFDGHCSILVRCR